MIDKLTTDLQSDSSHRLSDDEAFELAETILKNEPELNEYIKKVMKIEDPIGWLSNKIKIY